MWLAADIHLGPNSPKTAHAFYQFLQQAQHEAGALILCGDIFHAWIGADVAVDPPPWLAHAIYHFRNTALDLPIFFMRGNRDFLLDSRMAHYVGAQMLDDQVILQTDHHRLLLTHGDELCTDDVAYQKQKQKHLLPAISDVNETSCVELLKKHDEHILVHGHTHRPALHRMQDTEGHNYSRIVLPDWEYDHTEPTRSGWLALQADGQIALHRLHQPTVRFKLKKPHELS